MKNTIMDTIYQVWDSEFHMKHVQLPSNVECLKTIDCYQYKDFFVKLSTFVDAKLGRAYCIEAAEEQEARNNIFDDAWVYYESDGIDQIISEMKHDLASA